jgi:hypothetical protein
MGLYCFVINASGKLSTNPTRPPLSQPATPGSPAGGHKRFQSFAIPLTQDEREIDPALSLQWKENRISTIFILQF